MSYYYTTPTSNDHLPVAVIGAGTGGLPAATALVEAGIKVLLIDRGGVVSSSSFETNRFDYELLPRQWLDQGQEWKGLVQPQRAFGIGGSTLAFQGVSLLPPNQVLTGWGLSESDINRVGSEVVDILQIAGITQPAHRLNPVAQHMSKSAKKLGWSARPAPVAIPSQPTKDRPACVHCGLCVYGCKVGDKGSADRVWLPRALKTGRLKVMTGAEAKFLELGREKLVSTVYVQQGNTKTSIPVRAVVIAMGALETPRLLATSKQKFAWMGIGNNNVGRYLTGSLWRSMLVSAPVNAGGGHAGVPVDLIIELADRGIQLSHGRNLAGVAGPVSAAKMLSLYTSAPGKLREQMRYHYSRLSGLCGFAESSTSINDGIVDFKRQQLEKQITDEDLNKLAEIDDLLEKWRKSAGADLINRLENSSISRAMLRGTCRMGTDPETSAVAPDGRLYGYDNIVISDASVLARGMISEPSLTIQLLGYHFGQLLANRLKQA